MLLLKIACVYVPLFIGAAAFVAGLIVGNPVWMVIGGLIFAFTALPAKYDPAIQIKLRQMEKNPDLMG